MRHWVRCRRMRSGSLSGRRLIGRFRSLRGGSVPLGQVASVLAAQYGDRPALDQEDVGGLTFAEVSALVDERAAGLAAAGIQPGAPVLVSLRNGVPLLTGIL